MSIHATPSTKPEILLPDVPVLAVNMRHAVLMSTDGEIRDLTHQQAKMELHKTPVLVCHAPYTRTRLSANDLYGIDVLELFAFVHPATFCVPTPHGLSKALGIARPQSIEDYPITILEAARALLTDLQNEQTDPKRKDPADIAEVMGLQGKGWPWTPFVFAARGKTYDPASPFVTKTALNIWRNLPEWSEDAPHPPPSHHPVSGEESRARLQQLLSEGGKRAEDRPQQMEYTTKMAAAFAPLDAPSAQDNDGHSPNNGQNHPVTSPHTVLGEAGTGVGKTLGYLAPATVWSEKNDGTVWISTYTKNLQRQIDQELDRVYPSQEVKERAVAVRKGRENYLCLLNFEDLVNGAALAKHPDQAIASGLMARWAEKSRDGDINGGDFPGWLPGLLGYKNTRGLSDTRGECIYSACDHYHKCFVERSIRKGKRADIVVANHALVMIQTALSTTEDDLPKRYVFDEGHHLFDAADSAFAGHLTARETNDLRRWIKGEEGGKRTRARGLRRRVEDLVVGDQNAEQALEDIVYNAGNLPAAGWSRRLKERQASGPTEKFLALVYTQTYERSSGKHGPYSIETETKPLIDGLSEAAKHLQSKLRSLQTPMRKLSTLLKEKMNDNADTMDSDTRKRLEAVAAGLDRRAEYSVTAWIAMLDTLLKTEETPDYIDWMEIDRIEGKAVDIGLYRHWVDPMIPFAAALKPHAHGVAITSATLRDTSDDEEDNWRSALTRSGASYLSPDPLKFAETSPYNYAEKTRVFVISDVRKDQLDQVSAAYRVLFEAAGGGALGLFTSIQRLKAVRDKIIEPLETHGFPLYAQHADDIDTGTLVDMFREDTHACLLGTDAVRDGVDVPGESLRLLVYDRVPWPRPTILHKARRKKFGGRYYDEMITRLKIRQAFGRLVRSHDDKGVFVMLDSMLPTRLLGAFPEGTPIERIGLADTVTAINDFFKDSKDKGE